MKRRTAETANDAEPLAQKQPRNLLLRKNVDRQSAVGSGAGKRINKRAVQANS
jgi:hypothetical protein